MATSTITHFFDDDANTNISLTSSDSRVSVSAQATGDPGGPYQKSTSRKHYLVTISGANISSTSDVSISVLNSSTASGLTTGVSFKDIEKVSSTSVRVWFSGATDNSFCRQWSVTWSANVDGGSENVFAGEATCPTPTPWSQLLPTCASPPTAQTSSGGLQITKSGSSGIILNLKNYANRLVTLKITHSKSAAWQNGFSFSIPTCSDIAPNTGGTPYAKSSFSNSNISGSTTWYVYNIDGGDYNYTFSHSSVPGPRPTRSNWVQVCTTSTETVTSTNADGDTVSTEVTTTTCVCNEYTETYDGQWPHCPVGVAIVKNGGTTVSWAYEDGGGTPYGDQTVTVEILAAREVVKSSGTLCLSSIRDSVWIADPADSSADGNCIGDYKDHSTAFSEKRFRNPATQTSLTQLPVPICFTAFRGLAGAKTPSELGF